MPPWSRVWIVQEYLVARTPVFNYGHHKISGECLVSGYCAMQSLLLILAVKRPKAAPASALLLFSALLDSRRTPNAQTEAETSRIGFLGGDGQANLFHHGWRGDGCSGRN